VKRYLSIVAFVLITIKIFPYDTLSTKSLVQGVDYIKLADTSKPIVIDILKIDLKNPSLNIDVALANDALNLGGERTSDLINRKLSEGEKIIAGVNADFFGGDPMQAQNSMIINGEIVKAVNLKRTQIAFKNNNIPAIGRFRFDSKGIDVKGINWNDTTLSSRMFSHHWNGYIIKRSDRKYIKFLYDGELNPNVQEVLLRDINFSMPDSITIDEKFLLFEYSSVNEIGDTLYAAFNFSGLSSDIKAMTGGLPSLFFNGVIPDNFIGRDGMKSKRFLDINPRTAIGYDRNKTTLYIVTVDGRQPEYSMGISIKDLANFMLELGCYNALNFDGGGSTTMCVGDKVVNSPSDFTGERPVYNSLIIKLE
jgi:hypothetical protein